MRIITILAIILIFKFVIAYNTDIFSMSNKLKHVNLKSKFYFFFFLLACKTFFIIRV